MNHFIWNTGWKIAFKEDFLERVAFELKKLIWAPNQSEQPLHRCDRAG